MGPAVDAPVDQGDLPGPSLSEQSPSWAARARSLPLVARLERLFAPTWRRDLLAILVIVGACVPVLLAAQRPPGGTDDCVYFEYARDGKDVGAPHHQQRFALLGTVKL